MEITKTESQNSSLFKKPFQEAIYYFRSKYKNQISSIKISDLENILINENTPISILGLTYSPEKDIKKNLDKIENLKYFLKKMKKFTYSRKFKFCDKMVDDVGWSCTIRSGQMLLINLLIRNKILKNKKEIKDLEILKFFLYENEFSISNILKNGEINFNKKIKEQWSQKEFFETCSKILKNDSNQNNKISQDLFKNERIFEIVSSDGILIKENLLNIIKKKKKEILIILNIQLGFDKIEKKNENFLFSMLKSKFFSGAVAGNKNKAYFIFGLIKEQILYLDPHKIRNNEDTFSFKISQFNYLKSKNLSPSFCFGIFLKDLGDFEEFSVFVKKLDSDFLRVYNENEIDELSMNEIDIFENEKKNKKNFIIEKSENIEILNRNKNKIVFGNKNIKNIEEKTKKDFDYEIKTNFSDRLLKKVLKKETKKNIKTSKTEKPPKKTNISSKSKNSFNSKNSDKIPRRRKVSDMSFQIIEENSDKTLSVQNSRSSFQIPKNDIQEIRKKSETDINVASLNRTSFISLRSDKDIFLGEERKVIKEDDDEFLEVDY